MSGIERIQAERQRQIDVEGWIAEHDDDHNSGELPRAAAGYCLAELERNGTLYDEELSQDIFDEIWPWEAKWWKPSPDDRIKELAKAGALIAAEIDRLERAATNSAD